MIDVPNDRTKHCLRNDMLSVRIPSFIPELCALEIRSCEIEKTPLKDCSIREKYGKSESLDEAFRWKELDLDHQILQRGSRRTVDTYNYVNKILFEILHP